MWKMYDMSNWIGNNKRMEIWFFKQIFLARFTQNEFNAIHIFEVRHAKRRSHVKIYYVCSWRVTQHLAQTKPCKIHDGIHSSISSSVFQMHRNWLFSFSCRLFWDSRCWMLNVEWLRYCLRFNTLEMHLNRSMLFVYLKLFIAKILSQNSFSYRNSDRKSYLCAFHTIPLNFASNFI